MTHAGVRGLSDQPDRTVIRISLELDVTAEMENLRAMSYDDYVCGLDEFDGERSRHVTAWHGAEPVGMVRITVGPPFALVKWSEGRFESPSMQGVVEMTRGIVHPEFRQHGIYKALMIESMLRAESMGMDTAIAAVEPDFVGKPFLHSLGFVDFGAVCSFDKYFFAQPIRCELKHKEKWLGMYRGHIARMLVRGIQIESESVPEQGNSLEVPLRKMQGVKSNAPKRWS